MASQGIILKDQNTGSLYDLTVNNGSLTISGYTGNSSPTVSGSIFKFQDQCVTNTGQAIVNLNIEVLAQSGVGQPVTGPAILYSDALGLYPLSNPLTPGNGIDSLGNFSFYTTEGFYTLNYYGGIINGVFTQADVQIGLGTSINYGNTVVTGNANGVNTIFHLSSLPSNPTALLLTNGAAVLTQGIDYSIANTTITTNYPITSGSNLRAYYTVL